MSVRVPSAIRVILVAYADWYLGSRELCHAPRMRLGDVGGKESWQFIQEDLENMLSISISSRPCHFKLYRKPPRVIILIGDL